MTRCPCDTLSVLSQLEEQSDQLEKLRRELESKAGELVRVQEALSRTEQVCVGLLTGVAWGRAGQVRVLFPKSRATPKCCWVASEGPLAVLECCSDPAPRGDTKWAAQSRGWGDEDRALRNGL